jgi:hypothetical protein
MVDGKILRLSRQTVAVRFGLVANCADTLLGVQDVLIARGINAGVLPFALLDVVSVAKTFGVGVVAARLDGAGLCGRSAVSIHGVSMSQQALVMHLAQAFGLNRLIAAIFNTLWRLISDAHLDGADRRDATLKLHVMRLAIAARFMRTIAAVHCAGLVFFAHKKAPLS